MQCWQIVAAGERLRFGLFPIDGLSLAGAGARIEVQRVVTGDFTYLRSDTDDADGFADVFSQIRAGVARGTQAPDLSCE
jgi:hypothetical protein